MSVYKTYLEVAVYIDYDYQPEEPQTQDYPGCDADVTINSVEVSGFDIYDHLEAEQIERLETEILETKNEKTNMQSKKTLRMV